jgi:hypothetical protein
MKEVTELSHAEKLNETIKRYWAERGYDIEVSVAVQYLRNDHGHGYKSHVTKSNLVNGIPRTQD